jgi:hypothetical protein
MEGNVSTKDSYGEPEQLIAALNRKRQIMLTAALGGIVVALVGLFAATAAMYSKEPSGAVDTTKAALQPASAETR